MRTIAIAILVVLGAIAPVSAQRRSAAGSQGGHVDGSEYLV